MNTLPTSFTHAYQSIPNFITDISIYWKQYLDILIDLRKLKRDGNIHLYLLDSKQIRWFHEAYKAFSQIIDNVYDDIDDLEENTAPYNEIMKVIENGINKIVLKQPTTKEEITNTLITKTTESSAQQPTTKVTTKGPGIQINTNKTYLNDAKSIIQELANNRLGIETNVNEHQVVTEFEKGSIEFELISTMNKTHIIPTFLKYDPIYKLNEYLSPHASKILSKYINSLDTIINNEEFNNLITNKLLAGSQLPDIPVEEKARDSNMVKYYYEMMGLDKLILLSNLGVEHTLSLTHSGVIEENMVNLFSKLDAQQQENTIVAWSRSKRDLIQYIKQFKIARDNNVYPGRVLLSNFKLLAYGIMENFAPNNINRLEYLNTNFTSTYEWSLYPIDSISENPKIVKNGLYNYCLMVDKITRKNMKATSHYLLTKRQRDISNNNYAVSKFNESLDSKRKKLGKIQQNINSLIKTMKDHKIDVPHRIKNDVATLMLLDDNDLKNINIADYESYLDEKSLRKKMNLVASIDDNVYIQESSEQVVERPDDKIVQKLEIKTEDDKVSFTVNQDDGSRPLSSYDGSLNASMIIEDSNKIKSQRVIKMHSNLLAWFNGLSVDEKESIASDMSEEDMTASKYKNLFYIYSSPTPKTMFSHYYVSHFDKKKKVYIFRPLSYVIYLLSTNKKGDDFYYSMDQSQELFRIAKLNPITTGNDKIVSDIMNNENLIFYDLQMYMKADKKPRPIVSEMYFKLNDKHITNFTIYNTDLGFRLTNCKRLTFSELYKSLPPRFIDENFEPEKYDDYIKFTPADRFKNNLITVNLDYEYMLSYNGFESSSGEFALTKNLDLLSIFPKMHTGNLNDGIISLYSSEFPDFEITKDLESYVNNHINGQFDPTISIYRNVIVMAEHFQALEFAAANKLELNTSDTKYQAEFFDAVKDNAFFERRYALEKDLPISKLAFDESFIDDFVSFKFMNSIEFNKSKFETLTNVVKVGDKIKTLLNVNPESKGFPASEYKRKDTIGLELDYFINSDQYLTDLDKYNEDFSLFFTKSKREPIKNTKLPRNFQTTYSFPVLILNCYSTLYKMLNRDFLSTGSLLDFSPLSPDFRQVVDRILTTRTFQIMNFNDNVYVAQNFDGRISYASLDVTKSESHITIWHIKMMAHIICKILNLDKHHEKYVNNRFLELITCRVMTPIKYSIKSPDCYIHDFPLLPSGHAFTSLLNDLSTSILVYMANIKQVPPFAEPGVLSEDFIKLAGSIGIRFNEPDVIDPDFQNFEENNKRILQSAKFKKMDMLGYDCVKLGKYYLPILMYDRALKTMVFDKTYNSDDTTEIQDIIRLKTLPLLCWGYEEFKPVSAYLRNRVFNLSTMINNSVKNSSAFHSIIHQFGISSSESYAIGELPKSIQQVYSSICGATVPGPLDIITLVYPDYIYNPKYEDFNYEMFWIGTKYDKIAIENNDFIKYASSVYGIPYSRLNPNPPIISTSKPKYTYNPMLKEGVYDVSLIKSQFIKQSTLVSILQGNEFPKDYKMVFQLRKIVLEFIAYYYLNAKFYDVDKKTLNEYLNLCFVDTSSIKYMGKNNKGILVYYQEKKNSLLAADFSRYKLSSNETDFMEQKSIFIDVFNKFRSINELRNNNKNTVNGVNISPALATFLYCKNLNINMKPMSQSIGFDYFIANSNVMNVSLMFKTYTFHYSPEEIKFNNALLTKIIQINDCKTYTQLAAKLSIPIPSPLIMAMNVGETSYIDGRLAIQLQSSDIKSRLIEVASMSPFNFDVVVIISFAEKVIEVLESMTGDIDDRSTYLTTFGNINAIKFGGTVTLPFINSNVVQRKGVLETQVKTNFIRQTIKTNENLKLKSKALKYIHSLDPNKTLVKDLKYQIDLKTYLKRIGKGALLKFIDGFNVDSNKTIGEVIRLAQNDQEAEFNKMNAGKSQINLCIRNEFSSIVNASVRDLRSYYKKKNNFIGGPSEFKPVTKARGKAMDSFEINSREELEQRYKMIFNAVSDKKIPIDKEAQNLFNGYYIKYLYTDTLESFMKSKSIPTKVKDMLVMLTNYNFRLPEINPLILTQSKTKERYVNDNTMYECKLHDNLSVTINVIKENVYILMNSKIQYNAHRGLSSNTDNIPFITLSGKNNLVQFSNEEKKTSIVSLFDLPLLNSEKETFVQQPETFIGACLFKINLDSKEKTYYLFNESMEFLQALECVKNKCRNLNYSESGINLTTFKRFNMDKSDYYNLINEIARSKILKSSSNIPLFYFLINELYLI